MLLSGIVSAKLNPLRLRQGIIPTTPGYTVLE